jgi:hypothetical protein
MSLKRIGSFLLKELREVIPPTLFFFFAFSLLLFTRMLVLAQHGITIWDWGSAALGALVVGKVVLIVDSFRFIDRYPEKPLIWNAIWKTLIYTIAATLVRYLETILPEIFHGKSLAEANHLLEAGFDWNHFILIHMWLTVLLFVYCCLRELVRHIGTKKVARMFFHVREA